MEVSVDILINAPKERVWQIISDIDNSVETISAIEEIEILERPAQGLVGLKWRETRTMFGQTAVETMWITEAEENKMYRTLAESHGAIYRSFLELDEHDGQTRLKMGFTAEPQSLGAKIMSPLMGIFMKGSTRKALQQDLEDIKAAAEGRPAVRE